MQKEVTEKLNELISQSVDKIYDAYLKSNSGSAAFLK